MLAAESVVAAESSHCPVVVAAESSHCPVVDDAAESPSSSPSSVLALSSAVVVDVEVFLVVVVVFKVATIDVMCFVVVDEV